MPLPDSPLPSGTLPDNPVTNPAAPTTGPKTTTGTPRTSAPAPSSSAPSAPASPTDLTLPAPTYDLSHWTAPSASDLGLVPSVATVPAFPQEERAQLAAGVTPQVAGSDRMGIPHDSSTGGLPGLIVIIATVAVGTVAAGHVAFMQQRLAGGVVTTA